MRDDWSLETLGDISEVIMGRQLSPSKKLGTRPRRYIRAANIGPWGISLDEIFEMDFTEEEEARFACQIGDTLLVEGGNEKSVGCPGLVTEREAGLCIQNTVIRCRVKNPEVFHPQFQYHVLRNMYWRRGFAELCAGTTIMHLGQKRAELVRIPLPPLPEQRRIVDLMSEIDSYIEALQQQLESAMSSRRALVHNTLHMSNSDWKIQRLDQCTQRISDGSHNPPKGVEASEFLMLSSKDIWDGYITNADPRYLSESDFEVESRRTRLEIGDVLLTIVGTIGRCTVYRGDPRNVTFQRSVCVIKVNRDVLNENFLMMYLQSIQELLDQNARGVAQRGIYLNQIRNLEIPVPTLAEQVMIVSQIEVFDNFIQETQKAVTRSHTLRSSLLRELLSGEHEIPKTYDRVLSLA